MKSLSRIILSLIDRWKNRGQKYEHWLCYKENGHIFYRKVEK